MQHVHGRLRLFRVYELLLGFHHSSVGQCTAVLFFVSDRIGVYVATARAPSRPSGAHRCHLLSPRFAGSSITDPTICTSSACTWCMTSNHCSSQTCMGFGDQASCPTGEGSQDMGILCYWDGSMCVNDFCTGHTDDAMCGAGRSNTYDTDGALCIWDGAGQVCHTAAA